MNEQELTAQPLYQEVFRANLTVLVESVWHLMMTAIFGANSSECFATLGGDGSWQRMYLGYSLVKMDGFSDEFSGTWPKWGVLRGGSVFLPTQSVPHFGVSASRLWPRPIATDGLAWTRCKASNPRESIIKCWSKRSQDRPIFDFMWHGLSATQAAEYTGMMMGFPPRWTDLNATETQ